MVATESTMLELGTAAPDFSLTDPATGQAVSLGDFAGHKGLLVVFMCNHCPFVVHVADALKRLTDGAMKRGVGVVGICSNSVETHPADGPEKMAEEKQRRGYAFAYLHDADQTVAKAYTAACTPDFFLFKADAEDGGAFKLFYRGQFDDTRPNDEGQAASGEDLRAAIDALLAGGSAPEPQKPSMGCNIKWTPGQEPDYFGGSSR